MSEHDTANRYMINSLHAVLTFYNGQRRELAFQLRRAPVSAIRESWKAIKIVTVDSYQGEENEVVILSLVRNNDKNSIGFLDSVNRACVALSRAKRGFYMFGNSDLLSCQSELWANIMTEVQNQEAFGNEELRLAPCAHYQEGHCITRELRLLSFGVRLSGC